MRWIFNFFLNKRTDSNLVYTFFCNVKLVFKNFWKKNFNSIIRTTYVRLLNEFFTKLFKFDMQEFKKNFINNFWLRILKFFYLKLFCMKNTDEFLEQFFPILVKHLYIRTVVNKSVIYTIKKQKDVQSFKKEYKKVRYEEIRNLSKKTKVLISTDLFHIFDNFFVYIFSFIFKKALLTYSYKNNKIDLKLSQTKNNFIYQLNNKDYKQTLNLFGYGLKFLWKGVRLWILGIICGFSIIYYCLVVKLLPFNKVLFQWFLIIMFFYWLISGFVFFIKKYQYRYFTSSIQRFWRRSFIIFWVIEGFLFCIFIYLTVNANNEPVFMYDNSQVYKTHLFSWRYFLIKIFPSTLLIIFSYFVLLSIKWNIFSKSNMLVLMITIILLFIMWQEFYQFFHILSYYGNLSWVYDIEDHLWNLEVEFRRTRIVNHYVTICLAAKFWHLIFVLGFWLFFILRCLEIGRIRYPLFSANHQNFIIVYIMSWVYMYPWFKYIWKKFIEMPYFWFYVNTRRLGFFIFFNDLKLFYLSISDLILNCFYLFDFNFHFKGFDFFYWHNSSDVTGYTQYKKNYIRDNFIKSIYK